MKMLDVSGRCPAGFAEYCADLRVSARRAVHGWGVCGVSLFYGGVFLLKSEFAA